MNTPPPPTIDSLSQQMSDRKGVWWAAQSSRKVQGNTTPADKEATNAAEAWVKNPTAKNQAAAAEAAKKTDHQGPGAWAAQGAAWSKPAGAGAAGAGGPAGATGAAAGGGSSPLTAHAVAGSVKISAASAAGIKPQTTPPPKGGNESTTKAAAASDAAVKNTAAAKPAFPTKLANMPQATGASKPVLAKTTAPAKPGTPASPANAAAPANSAVGAKPPATPPPTPDEQAKMDTMHKPFIDLGKDVLSGKNTWT